MDPPVQLQQVANFRDVGKTINAFLGQRRIREGVFYRSARLDKATLQDKKLIRDDLNIRTIIDLRTKTEILKQAEKLEAQGDTAAPPHGNVSHIDGLDYQGIKLAGRSLERHFLGQLSWWDFFKVIFLFLLGYRIPAVRVISQQVLLPRGLIRLGLDTLDHSGSEICQALSVYASPQSLPSVVHCTQGKDRTGLICALVLMILEIPTSAIEYDYFLTDAALLPNRDEMLVEIHEIGLTEDWADTAKEMIAAIEEHLELAHQGLEGYLDQIGFGPVQRAQLQEALLY